MTTPPDNPLATAHARALDEERQAARAKDAAAELVRAVWRAEPESLPAEVRAARERLMRLGED